MWMNKVRYLGVHLVSSNALSCNFDLVKKSLYRAFNVIYGKVGRLASVQIQNPNGLLGSAALVLDYNDNGAIDITAKSHFGY